jgi:hypothetical protein
LFGAMGDDDHEKFINDFKRRAPPRLPGSVMT